MTIKTVSLLALLASAAFAQPEEGKRIALVIGNDTYSIRPLQNAVNDARVMEKSLTAAGFRVALLENGSRLAMETAASQFLSRIGPGDTALLYYAGHAIQVGGENVLIPVDFESAGSLIEVKLKSLSLSLFFGEFQNSRAKTIIVILDSCRTNPVADSHSLKAGLANPTLTGKSTYVAFSTSPGNVAGDNPNGRNSWFTEALADAINQPNLSLDDVFTRVRLKVESSTGGKQTPWSNTSLTSKFYFHPPANLEKVNDETIVAKWLDDAKRNEQYENWREAIELSERIVKQKPGGAVEEAAKARLPYLRLRDEAEVKFEAGDFAGAAQRYEEALKLEPFDVEAAFDAANSALIDADTPRAVRALEAVRLRGASPQVARADAILKELAPVEPAAAATLKAGLAKPPALPELFPSQRFGLPDWEAGRRWVRQGAPADYGAIVKQLPPPVAVPKAPEPIASAAVAAPPADETRITLDDLYVEVKTVAGSRDLVSEEFGQLTIRSAKKSMGVMIDGKPVSKQLPFTVKLPPGEYELRTMEAGRKIAERRVKIRAEATTEMDLH